MTALDSLQTPKKLFFRQNRAALEGSRLFPQSRRMLPNIRSRSFQVSYRAEAHLVVSFSQETVFSVSSPSWVAGCPRSQYRGNGCGRVPETLFGVVFFLLSAGSKIISYVADISSGRQANTAVGDPSNRNTTKRFGQGSYAEGRNSFGCLPHTNYARS